MITQYQPKCANNTCIPESTLHQPISQELVDSQSTTTTTQDRGNVGSGTQYKVNSQPKTVAQPVYQAFYPAARPVPVTTQVEGSSYGGSQTTTNTQYEEHTITNGQAFSTK